MKQQRLKRKRQNDPTYCPYSLILPADNSLGKLFLGDVYSLDDWDFLVCQSILTILTCCQQTKPVDRIGPHSNLIHVVQLNLKDEPDEHIIPHIETAFLVIDTGRSKGNVLVHCMAGVSRSASFVIAYVMRKQGKGFEQALQFVKERRAKANPNQGFVRQLLQYETELKLTKQGKGVGKGGVLGGKMLETNEEESISENRTNSVVKIYQEKCVKPKQQVKKFNLAQIPRIQATLNNQQAQSTRLDRLKAQVNYMTVMLNKKI